MTKFTRHGIRFAEDDDILREAQLEQMMKPFELIQKSEPFDDDGDIDIWGARKIEESDDTHQPDMNMPAIDLKKAKPVREKPAKNIYSHDWKLQVIEQSDLKIYDENCTGYEFKGGMVFLTFKLNTKTARNIHFHKQRVQRIAITHYDLGEEPKEPVLIMEYSVMFSHIEVLNNDEMFLEMTLVYKLMESHHASYEEF